MHGRLQQPKNGDVQQLSQCVQAGLEHVADQERVVTLLFRPQAVVQDFAGVEVFQIPVLIRQSPAGRQAEDPDLAARSSGIV